MRLKKGNSSQRGFTLLELLIALVLGSMVMAGLIELYSTGQKYFINESARSDIVRDGRSVLLWMSRDIKEAIQVMSSYDTYSTTTNSLVLRVPSIDADGVILDIDTDFDYIVYQLNSIISSKLERIVIPKSGVSSRAVSNRVLANSVNSIVLKSDGTELSSVGDVLTIESIDIDLILRELRFDRTFEEPLNTMVKLRNKDVAGG